MEAATLNEVMYTCSRDSMVGSKTSDFIKLYNKMENYIINNCLYYILLKEIQSMSKSDRQKTYLFLKIIILKNIIDKCNGQYFMINIKCISI